MTIMVFIRSQTIQVGNVVIVGEQRRASNLINKLTLSERELKGAANYQEHGNPEDGFSLGLTGQ